MSDVQPAAQIQREKLRKVFEFLKAYLELRFPPLRDVERQLRTLWLKNLPQHPSVEVFRADTDSEDETGDADVVLHGRHVMTGSGDGSARLWDAATCSAFPVCASHNCAE